MMATTTIMKICFYFITSLYLVAGSAITVYSHENLDVPSRISHYITQNFIHYNGTISTMEIYLTEFKKNYFDRIDTLQLNEEFLHEELNRAMRQINPLETLDDMRNFCVNKYRGNLPDFNIVETNLINCKNIAINFYNSIISTPLTTQRNLRTYYASTFPNELKACAKRHEKNETAYIDCVLTTVRTTNTVTTNNIKNFHNQLKQSQCAAKQKIQETFDCHNPSVFNTLSKIGEIIGLMDNCIAGREFCPSNGETVDLGRCPYHMSLHVDNNNVIKPDEIEQILKSVGKTTPCLQINFIRKELNAV